MEELTGWGNDSSDNNNH